MRHLPFIPASPALPQPLRPGEKRQKEDWENIWVYGMTFNLLLAFAVVVLKPDTR